MTVRAAVLAAATLSVLAFAAACQKADPVAPDHETTVEEVPPKAAAGVRAETKVELPEGAIAVLPPLSPEGKKMLFQSGKSLSDLGASVPTVEQVGVAGYPGAFFASSVSARMNESIEVWGVNLVTADAPEQVVAWYQEQLGSDWRYDETHGVFVKGGQAFDLGKLAELTTVSVMEEQGGLDLMHYNLPKVRTRIQINQPRSLQQVLATP